MSETISKEPYGELVEHVIGGGWGSDDPGDGLQRVRVIRGTDFANVRNLQFAEVPTRYESASKIPQRTLRDGDVVLEISGGSRSANQSTGRTLFISDNVLAEFADAVIPASFCRLVRFNRRKVDPLYAYYGLQDMYNAGRAAEYEHQSTGLSNFQFKHFLETERLRLPPLPEQRAIAEVLGSLDDKIEQNRRTAAKLEALARATFRAWFVDFAPVHAKAAGATSYPGLPPTAFDALPTTFQESALGLIPEGWEVKALDSVAHFLNGLALQKYPPRENGSDLPVIKIAQLRKGSTEGADSANDSMDEKYKIEDRDFLFSWSGTLEAVFWFGGRGALNQHLFKVTSEDYPAWLVYEWVHQHLAEFRLIASSKATTMGHIKRVHLKQALIAIPSDDILKIADETMLPLFDLHANLQLEARKLASLRDYLLPRLLSGAVRVGLQP